MSKLYSKNVLDILCKGMTNCIVETTYGTYAGILINHIYYGLYLKAFTINDGGIILHRSNIKRIILLSNGLVYPKNNDSKSRTKSYKHLNIIELSELLNKAGYEFI